MIIVCILLEYIIVNVILGYILNTLIRLISRVSYGRYVKLFFITKQHVFVTKKAHIALVFKGFTTIYC